ncbi:MAG: SDR family oxidoreductase [Bacteroidota bacterium]|nr:MAG: SDR family oxidoreductase [Bacteroidota bacterium]
MDLQIKDKYYIVCGATSGFGLAITKLLIAEGAKVLAIARQEEKLIELNDAFADSIDVLAGDITQSTTIEKLLRQSANKTISGVVVNAGGPPAMKFVETKLTDWDEAYHKILRWKVELTQAFLPILLKNGFGRMLYIESASVKQPLENLVLSTSMRLSVVGFVKTLSQEMPDKGVTFNVLAPGYHYTPAVERLIDKKAKDENISKKQARLLLEERIPMHKTGSTEHFASLAAWLLSPLSDYITGQVYAVDGGVIRGVF